MFRCSDDRVGVRVKATTSRQKQLIALDNLKHKIGSFKGIDKLSNSNHQIFGWNN